MKYINKYSDFSLNEKKFSKNDPIPELSKSSKLGIILLGAPGVGKSTFASNFIIPRVRTIKSFSTDDISLMYSKDPNVYHVGSSEKNISRLKKFIESGQSFIYDTTGAQDRPVFDISSLAKKNGYTILFIHLIGTLDLALKQNIERDRFVDPEYIKFVYDRQFQNMKSYSDNLKPDSYYIVYNRDGKYKFYKYSDNKIHKRKVDTYKPLVKESVDVIGEVDKIVDTMLDFIDENEKVTFSSTTGHMTYSDYLAKNDRYKNFRPILVSKNRTVSKFSIVYEPKDGSYDNFIIILDNMKSTIGRLSDLGWVLSDFDSRSASSQYGKEVLIKSVDFEFTKPDFKHDGEFGLPDEDELRSEIEKMGIGVSSLSIGDYETELEFFSNSWDGGLNSEGFYDDKFTKICDIFGFERYDLDYNNARVIFEH